MRLLLVSGFGILVVGCAAFSAAPSDPAVAAEAGAPIPDASTNSTDAGDSSPRPTPDAGAECSLFNEIFDDPSAPPGWTATGASVTFGVQSDTRKVLKTTTSGKTSALAARNLPSSSPFHLKVDLRATITNEPTGSLQLLNVACGKADPFHGFRLFFDANGFYVFVFPDNLQTRLDKNLLATWHRYAFDVDGTKLTMSVDGAVIATDETSSAMFDTGDCSVALGIDGNVISLAAAVEATYDNACAR